MSENIAWTPQPKQTAFMERPEFEALYGGAAGGGKSDALLAEALRQVDNGNYRGLLLRKTYPQLTELIDRSMILYKSAFPKAVYNDSKHVWSFPSGAKIYFGSMQYTKDRINYQGKRYDFIGFDELTHFTWEEYSYMFSRARPSKKPGSREKTRVYIRSTSNPGGVGHGWVKERFITPAPPMTPIAERVTVETPEEGKKEITRERIFIPATVFDNKELLRNDPNYVANLALMPEAEKNALLYGDWDSFEGQVFREWKDDPAHYEDGRFTHVIAPFMPPKHWKCWRGFDFGYTKPFSVGWYVADEDGRIYRIKEYYGCSGVPNEGVKLNPFEIAGEIKRIESEDPMLKGRDILGVADPSIFDESRGESVAQMMLKSPNFIYWTPGDNARIAGKMQYHYRLSFDEEGLPLFQVFNTCKHFIRTVPNLVYDTKHVEDINTEGEDHIYDECRYVLMESPISPKAKEEDINKINNPLDSVVGKANKSKRRYY